MARRQFTGTGAIYFVPIITTKAAPTAAQIIAGVNLTGCMVRNGLKRPQAGNVVDTADASTRFNKTDVGTYGGDKMEITFHRDTKLSLDTAWTTLPRDTIGYIVAADNGFAQNAGTGIGTPTGTPTVGDRCQVWPATVNTRVPMDTAENESNKFTCELVITDEPALDAVVA